MQTNMKYHFSRERIIEKKIKLKTYAILKKKKVKTTFNRIYIFKLLFWKHQHKYFIKEI